MAAMNVSRRMRALFIALIIVACISSCTSPSNSITATLNAIPIMPGSVDVDNEIPRSLVGPHEGNLQYRIELPYAASDVSDFYRAYFASDSWTECYSYGNPDWVEYIDSTTSKDITKGQVVRYYLRNKILVHLYIRQVKPIISDGGETPPQQVLIVAEIVPNMNERKKELNLSCL